MLLKPGMLEAAAAVGTPVAEEEREAVAGPDARVVRRHEDAVDAGSETAIELVAHRRLRPVVDEIHLRIRRDAARDQPVEAGLALIRRVPDDRLLAVAGSTVERELERANAPLQPEFLVEPCVVEDAIVVAAVPAEEDVPAAAGQIVGQPDARLPRAIERRTIAAIREVAACVHEGRRRDSDVIGCDVVVVQHVRLVVPPETAIECQPRLHRVRRPVVLHVEAELTVVGAQVRDCPRRTPLRTETRTARPGGNERPGCRSAASSRRSAES